MEGGSTRIDEKMQQQQEGDKIEELKDYIPVLRSGSWADIGPTRAQMEDEHILMDKVPGFQSLAFYGVFDGHCGGDAATFIKENLLNLILREGDVDFWEGGFGVGVEKAIKNAFLKADDALAEAHIISSGTTALVAMVSGKSLVVANAGDCRAVLGKRGGIAVEMSTDHKPTTSAERSRIKSQGGFVTHDGYLNRKLAVSRALGDLEVKACSPLIADPDVQQVELSEEDEFLVIACDGLWDVLSSERAVAIARRELMSSNDPEGCSRVLLNEALASGSGDNITVVVVCFSARPPLPTPHS